MLPQGISNYIQVIEHVSKYNKPFLVFWLPRRLLVYELLFLVVF